MKCPCIECEKKGCGTYHDICEPYQEYVKARKDDRSDIHKRYEFTRKKRKFCKNHKGWDHQKNVGY